MTEERNQTESGCGCGGGGEGGCGGCGGGSGKGAWIVVALAMLGVGAAMSLLRNKDGSARVDPAPASAPTAVALSPVAVVPAKPEKPLPRLVDLGAHACIQCKMMTPVLEGLRTNFTGRMQVDFIDVWQNPDEGKKYGVETIPTQIFFDAAGKELFRHTGFISREDILKKWKELNIDVTSGQDANSTEGQPAVPEA